MDASEQQQLNRFVIKSCYAVLPVLMLIVVVNFIGDAACLFREPYPAMLAAMQQGKNITNIPNYDERVFQRHVIDHLEQAPDVIVLGSSRSRLIDSEFFPNETLFNHSVSGASLEDLIAINQMYRSHGLTPKRVVIGVDPWLLNENNIRTSWLSIKEEYDQFLKVYNLTSSYEDTSTQSKYWQLVSPSYFQHSIKRFEKLDRNFAAVVATTQHENDMLTILPDGAMVYEARTRNRSPEKVEAKAHDYIQGKIYRIEGFDTISQRMLAEFDQLIQDLSQRDAQIEFLLTPYHPVVYSVVRENYPTVLKAEQTIRQYANEHGIRVTGSYDPSEFQFTGKDFYDGMHCKKSAIERILVQSERLSHTSDVVVR